MWRTLVLIGTATIAAPALAISNDELRATLEQRFKDDRTGACVAAAVIEGGKTAKAFVCANPKHARPYDEHTAFEIGSISKTMTAALLAEMIARGEIALSDPLAKLLPPGTAVPSFNGRQITIGDVVTHASGLPSVPPLGMGDMNNPYASVTERNLLDALASAKLTRAPGSQWEYSNFAMMVLSYAIAKRVGKDFESLLRERLLAPLGMNETYIAKRPAQVRAAAGHMSNGLPASAWDLPVDMAGVGGVRATLPDMQHYLEAQIGVRASAIAAAIEETQKEVATVGGHHMAMNWILAPLNGRIVAAHDGGTGGFSSSMAFDRASKRGYVMLSDTSLTALGGFGTIGVHLLDSSMPIGKPRLAATADPGRIDALVGRYRLQGGLGIELRHKGKALTVQADGQPEFEMGFDDAGDFYPLKFDALLRPKRNANGYTFTWFQMGAQLEAERAGPP